MRKIPWFFIFILLAGCSSSAAQVRSKAQSAPSAPASLPAPEGWVPYPSPSADSPAIGCAKYSKREWKVTPDGENIKVRLDTLRDHQDPLPSGINLREVDVGSKGDRHVIRVKDGWLVGIDVGEFGGSLWWFSSDGGSRKKLADENIVGFAKSSAGILALAGLAHMGFDSGKILRITNGAAGNRKIEMLVNLGATPSAFAVESPDSLLIVTTRGLVRVKTSGVLELLFSTNYASLYPNSMTLSASGVVHVGMRHFITRLTPKGKSYREEWFAPVGCLKFRVRDYDCVCVSGRK